MRTWFVVATALALLTALAGCDTINGSDSSSNNKKKDGGDGTGGTFEVIGTSGEVVDMDGTWSRFEGACHEGSTAGQGELAPRVFDGDQMTMTVDNWLDSLTCDGDSDTTVVFEFILTVDKQVTGIVWVDIDGVETAAPAGLEDVTDANGLTYTVDSATATANTDAGATDWVTNVYGGETDWVAGTEHDVLDWFIAEQFGGDNPFKSSLIMDDTTDPANPTWYDSSNDADTDEDGIPDADEDGYPTTIENLDPFTKE